MRAICVDDEEIILESIVQTVSENPRISDAIGFSRTDEAIKWMKKNTADIAFLDIAMQMNGLELARKIRSVCSNIHVVFITGYSEYAFDAFKLHADGYLLKPVSSEDIEEEIKNLHRYSKPLFGDKRIFIQAFGNFEVFVDGKPLCFSNRVAKEIFAYLVDKKGAYCTTGELEIITEEYANTENSRKTMVRQGICAIRKALGAEGMDDVIEKRYNGIRIVKEKVDCDYYSFLEGNLHALNLFTGEYMSNYSWAEETCGWMYKRL